MKQTLLAFLIPAAIACGSPQSHNREHRSNMRLPVSPVASEMAQDIRSRNLSDAPRRVGEHRWSLGEVSQSQERMYRTGVAQDANGIMSRIKDCYHDTDLAHCAPSLGKYFADWD